MLPVVLLMCAWWRHGQVRVKDLLGSAPFFLLSLVAGLVTIWFQRNRALEGHSYLTGNMAARLATAGCAPWFYLWKVLLPLNLCVIYPQWHIDASNWLVYLPGIFLVACLAVLWRARGSWGRPWLFAIAYFVVVLFPVLGFFEQGFYQYSPVADPWLYPAIAAPIALAVAGAASISRRRQRLAFRLFPPGSPLFAIAVVMLLGTATWTREGIYADDETLWRNAAIENPSAWIAQYNLGVILWQTGRIEDAMVCYERALRIKPDYPEADNDFGVALMQTGRLPEAIDHLEQAVRLKPDFAEAHNNLATALLQVGNVREAIAHFEQALRSNPNYAETHYKLGTVLEEIGQPKDAIEHFEQAVRLKPDFAEAHSDLGIALCRMGKAQEAITHFEQAVRIEPHNARVHYNFGLALELTGKPAEAIGQYELALRIKPDYAEVHNKLALSLWRMGKRQEAIGHWEEALRIKPDFILARDSLGDALHLAGKPQDAIGQYEQALAIQPDAADIQNRLAWLLATLAPAEGGDPARALALAQRACELTNHRNAACVDTLAAAYASAGLFNDAVATAQSAIELARTAGQTELICEAEARLELYREGRAYRESVNITNPHTP
jgi:tetratricopeptide (TPR) repeat protein